MQKSSINPKCLQEMLDCAPNAADRGQSQFFTPLPFGRLCASVLPRFRPAIVDLTAGAGHLLQASAASNTSNLYALDIDPGPFEPVEGQVTKASLHRLTRDLTRLYEWLAEINLRADCFALNPPWGLGFYRDRLAALGNSDLVAVREALAGLSGANLPNTCLDSTVATLLIALDRCTTYGEGFLIANEATLERLLFAPNAPHAAVTRHIWAHWSVPGNPMMGSRTSAGLENCQWQEEQSFRTGVIWFAREHTTGPQHFAADAPFDPKSTTTLPFSRAIRLGAELRTTYLADDTLPNLWSALRQRLREEETGKPSTPWNLWLTAGGVIRTALSRWEELSVKVNKKEAARLHKLEGHRPMSLVLQRAQRDELTTIAEKSGWRVQPELIAAIRRCVQEYHASRAPLYPLPEIQRLGYLDEQDKIECKLDLRGGGRCFVKGQHYPLRTQTLAIERNVKKPNSLTGIEDDIVYNGQELAIFLSLGDDEFCFMDQALKNDKHTKIPQAKRFKGVKSAPKDVPPVDFTLQQLCAHFIIPDVPDVATVNPAGFQQHLKTLEAIEAICNLN